MELRQQILRFTSRYQTVGWMLLFLAGALILQLLLMLVLPKEMYSQVMSFLVLPSRLKDLLVQPWSLVTWPFFMLKLQFITVLFSGLIFWSFGQIHQHLLGDTRTRRLLIMVIPIIGILSVSISTFLPTSPFDAGPESSEFIALGDSTISEPEQAIDSLGEESVNVGPSVAADREKTGRGELLSNPALVREINLWFPSGTIPLIMVLVVSCATLVPSYPIQLMFLGRVKILYIAIALFILEMLWSMFITPMAITIVTGAFLGFLHVYFLRNGTDITELVWSFYSDSGKPKMKVKYGELAHTQATGRSSASSAKQGDIPQEVIDGILDKISAKGYESLSREEKELLFRASTQKEDE
ncbi:MAG: hypothetical protein NWR72_11360 [Bacteroidia bacterium]|nr:hypothetical protein [Bacteroidia bacterium]